MKQNKSIAMALLTCGAILALAYWGLEVRQASVESPRYVRESLAFKEAAVGREVQVDRLTSRSAEELAAASAIDAGGGKPDTPLDKITAGQADRYLIKNATLSIETGDARNATAQLLAALQALDGYLSKLQESVDGLGHRLVSMQVRVPAAQFDAWMTQVETVGRVLNKQITTEDVTEEFVDTDARTRNLKKAEERLLDHLSRYGELDQVLHVEQELTRVRGEIERLEGRLKYLGNRVEYSTLTITLQEKPKAEPIVPAEAFSTAQVASEAVRSLVGFSRSIWRILIWVGVWSPFWLLPAAVLAWACRTLTRRARRPDNR